MGRYTLAFWLPFYLRKELHFEEGAIAYVLMAHDTASMAGGMLFSMLLDSLYLGQARHPSRASFSPPVPHRLPPIPSSPHLAATLCLALCWF